MEDFRAVGRRLSNWGRWGADDRIGTLNFLTAERVATAAGLVKRGAIFDLGIEIGKPGVQRAAGIRSNPVHLMNLTPLDSLDHMGGLKDVFVADDYIMMPLQSVTQWDGLGHVGYDGKLYNDIDAGSITTLHGSTELSIHHIAQRGIVGRGVLLDIASLIGVDRLPAGAEITPDMLDTAASRQGVAILPGDILLVRTGWIRQLLIDRDVETYWKGEPGLTLACAEWLHRHQIAAVASDNWGVETRSPDGGTGGLPVHSVLIRDMGMTLGEIFDLEALASDCRADGVWEFFFAAPPLKVVGGVGTPITPLALK